MLFSPIFRLRLASAALITMVALNLSAEPSHRSPGTVSDTAEASAGTQMSSGTEPVTLLELYTSEGCSSCPPADRWLSRLLDDPRLWHRLVPVAFHVDYWDYIGWPDRFARPAYSMRQREHARHDGLSQVYTPAMVVDGKEWRGFFRGAQLRLDEPDINQSGPGILSLRINGQQIDASFSARRGLSMPRLHLSVLGFDQRSRVSRGENAGRTLQHDFVVLAYASHPLQPLTDGGFQFSGQLPQAQHRTGRRAIAAWISEGDKPTPLQAVGGWLK